MAHPVDVAVTAIGAFIGTNIDDFVVLLLLISGMPVDKIGRWQIVTGQYLGFCVLLVVSSFGALALRTISENWVGLLGFVPLALGVRGFIQARRSSDDETKTPIIASNVIKVAVVTVANGGDNISVYVLLFRQLDTSGVVLTVAIFLFSLAVLCIAALIIGQNEQIIPHVVRSNKWLTPSVFVIIGILLLMRTGAIAHLIKII